MPDSGRRQVPRASDPPRTEPDPLLAWLYSLRGPSLKWDRDTAERFSRRLGHPWRRYPSIQVGGTNGKGSVAASIHAIAGAHGLRCGLFTSPHLVRPEERIRIGPDDIAPASLRELIEWLRQRAAEALEQGALERHPSFFEMVFAAAAVAFARARVDLAVFEVGLGGRLDATSVVRPAASVVTTVSLDHTRTLGSTLAAIATEKGGIAKPGVPLVAGWLAPEAREALRREVARRGGVWHDAARECRLVHRDDTFDVTTPDGTYRSLRAALAGRHQRLNAALAIRALELAGGPLRRLDETAVRRGLARVRWPGRIECVGARPATVLDAAHNDEAARALASWLAENDTGGGPTVFVVGTSGGRDPRRLLSTLVTRPTDQVILTRAEVSKAVAPESVLADWPGDLPRPRVEKAPRDALDAARRAAGPRGRVVVTGSLYLVGDARRVLLGLTGPGHPRRETDIPPAATAPPPGVL